MPKINDNGSVTGSYFMNLKGLYQMGPVSLKTDSTPSVEKTKSKPKGVEGGDYYNGFKEKANDEDRKWQ
jgi:hypothetical protein